MIDHWWPSARLHATLHAKVPPQIHELGTFITGGIENKMMLKLLTRGSSVAWADSVRM